MKAEDGGHGNFFHPLPPSVDAVYSADAMKTSALAATYLSRVSLALSGCQMSTAMMAT